MASISFEDAVKNEFSGNAVEWFNLKNNGDEAIVRFMHDSTADFDIVSTHPIEIDGKYAGKVNCLREAHDPMENCPLCAAGIKLENKFFIHLVKYENENGVMVGKPMVWERSMAYAKRLKDLLVDYGPLSGCLFKIRRNGAAGDMKTEYAINYCPPQQYAQENFPVDTTVFDGYTAVGNAVISRPFADLVTYATTGRFPQTETATVTTADPLPEWNNVPQQQVTTNVPPVQQPFTQQTTAVPTQQYQTVGSEMNGIANLNAYGAGVQQPVVNRPVRTY